MKKKFVPLTILSVILGGSVIGGCSNSATQSTPQNEADALKVDWSKAPPEARKAMEAAKSKGAPSTVPTR